MALIACTECGKQISDTAAACPGCGAPVANSGGAKATTAAPLAAPVAVAKSSNLNAVLWGATIVILAIAAGMFLALKGAKDDVKAEQERVAKLPEMPIQLSHRRAITGPGLVISFKNSSNRVIAVAATFRNPSLNQEKTVRIDLSPNQVREVGHLEGWTFASGDTIRVTHNDYRPLEARIP